MNSFREIQPENLKENFFRAIGDDWMLVTAEKRNGSVNTMTASWGGIGIMWSKPVCMCMIRPQRYTFEFVNENEELTLSFLEEGNREALKICGTVSGRECDKINISGLHLIKIENSPTFEESRLVIVGKKIYEDDIRESCFIDKSLIESKYPLADYHRIFICEITKVYIKG